MFENIMNFFKKASKKEGKVANNSKTAAKERLHLVLMQDRANVSADFLELMKQEIIEVIKKYIDVDESAIDVRLTNKENADGTNGAPALYANIPILNIIKEEKKTKEEDKNKSEVKESENKENKAKETNKKDKSKEETLEVKKEENKKDEKEIKEEVSKKDDSNKEDKKEKLEENKEEKTKETKKEEKLEKEEKTEKVQEKVLEQK